MTNQDHLQQIKDIKKMMEDSSKFISLSGLSGISAGICAVIGAGFAYFSIENHEYHVQSRINAFADKISGQDYSGTIPLILEDALTMKLAIIATVTLVAALGLSSFFTIRRTKRNNQSVWSSTSKRLLFNTSIPLIAGGLFCLVLIKHNLVGLLAPATLIFFGLALVNGSKYTLPEIKVVGIVNILLGVINGLFIGYGLIFWALGFGLVNIIYGIYMYSKYEKVA
jgi:hypothetical protein